MEFYTIDELCTDSRLFQTEKYVPNKEEMVSIQKFAEKHNESGIVKVFLDHKDYIVCNKIYNYHDGSEPIIFVIFNAEMVWGDDIKYFNAKPDFFLSITLSSEAVVKAPIQHAYFRHIMWEEEFENLLDLLDEANEIISDYLDDDDDDERNNIHIY